MEENKTTKKTTTKTSSNIPKKKTAKSTKVASNLNSDELLEQILNKKKQKSMSKKTTNTTRKKSTSVNTNNLNKKVNTTNLSNDDIYELIKAKKSKKSTKTVNKSINDNEIKDALIREEKSIDNSKINVEQENIHEEKKKVEENLIITREIRFSDENLNLKNKKLLKELNDAIKEFDSLDNSVVKQEEIIENTTNTKKKRRTIDDEIGKLLPAVRYDKQERTKFFLITGICVLSFFMVCMLSWYFLIQPSYANNPSKEFDKLLNIEEEKVDLRPQLLEECLKKPLSEIDRTQELIDAENDLTNYLKNNYKTSVMYEDLNLGFKYSYNTDVVYYAASTIKSLGALYIYTKAYEGEIDLDSTIKYTAKFKWSSSKEMSKHKIGDEVSLRKLVEYSVVVSDNSAHQMLVSYIGKNTLKEFGNSLGAKYTMSTSDNFGNITTNDAIIYVKAINDFINNSGDLGDELKSYFVRAEQNDIALPDLNIEAAHKYGQYSYFYHDIGIVYDKNPYVIAILTHEGNKDFENKVKDINKHVYELHRAYNDNRYNVCYTEVYSE